MGNSAIPTLIDALVSQADAAISTATVYDGYGVSDDPGDYLMVGVDDPDSDEFAESGEARQEWAGLGANARNQTGAIWLVAQSVDGDGDQKAARDAAYALMAAVEDMIATTPDLGVITTGWCRPGGEERLRQNQSDAGAVARVAFTVAFQARL